MKFFALLIFVFIIRMGHCQTLICDSNVVPKKGIYRTFEEFRTNSPGLDTLSFTVEVKIIKHGFGLQEEHENYRLILNRPKALTMKDSIWGFCDGNSIYYNLNEVYSKKSRFEKLIYVGRYCMFDVIELRNSPSPIIVNGAVAAIGSVPTHQVMVTYAINFNNGLVFQLNKANMKRILSVDTLMLDDYQEENQKNKLLKEYLIEFSESHKDKIKR